MLITAGEKSWKNLRQQVRRRGLHSGSERENTKRKKKERSRHP